MTWLSLLQSPQQVELSLGGVVIMYDFLIHKRHVGRWKIHHCIVCNMDTHGVPETSAVPCLISTQLMVYSGNFFSNVRKGALMMNLFIFLLVSQALSWAPNCKFLLFVCLCWFRPIYRRSRPCVIVTGSLLPSKSPCPRWGTLVRHLHGYFQARNWISFLAWMLFLSPSS